MKNLNKISAEKWIGIILFVFILGTACTHSLFNNESEKVQRVKPLFDSEVQKFGVALGKSFKKTFREVKAQNIKDKSEIEKLASKNSISEFERAGLISQKDENFVLERTAETSKAAVAKKKTLSKSQKKVMGQIQGAMQNSKSFLDFNNQLANINNSLFLNAPAKEQKGLQAVIATFYYTFDAMNDLMEEEGLDAPETQTQKAGFSFSLPFSLSLQTQVYYDYPRLTHREKIAKKRDGYLYGKRLGFSEQKAREFAEAYMQNWDLGIGDREPSMTATYAMKDMGMDFWDRFSTHYRGLDDIWSQLGISGSAGIGSGFFKHSIRVVGKAFGVAFIAYDVYNIFRVMRYAW